MRRKLLICEDDDEERDLLTMVFPQEEFVLRTVASGERALEGAFDWSPDIIVLDVSLPGVSGLEVCRILKGDSRTQNIPILMLSAHHSKEDIVAGLKSGTDDYLAKPFHGTELLWRVRGLLRRYAPVVQKSSQLLQMGPITLDVEQGRLSVDGRGVRLTKTECDLLEVFLKSPGRVLKRNFLMETVWGYDQTVTTRTVDLYVHRLRKKLGAKLGSCLQTLSGFGYCLKVEKK